MCEDNNTIVGYKLMVPITMMVVDPPQGDVEDNKIKPGDILIPMIPEKLSQKE